jgi:hypothetical protein
VNDYEFNKQIRYAEGKGVIDDVKKILNYHIPGVERIEKATKEEDLKGTDYWVYRKNINKPLSIDVKARSDDPVVKFGMDDLALETWSVIEKEKIGWTLDENKQTDFILWFFEPTKRFVLLPFVQLLTVAKEHMPVWKREHRVYRQGSNNGDWHSECVFVPRKAVLDAITNRFYGPPKDDNTQFSLGL